MAVTGRRASTSWCQWTCRSAGGGRSWPCQGLGAFLAFFLLVSLPFSHSAFVLLFRSSISIASRSPVTSSDAHARSVTYTGYGYDKLRQDGWRAPEVDAPHPAHLRYVPHRWPRPMPPCRSRRSKPMTKLSSSRASCRGR